ncbi:MAG: hypothetical protein P8N52_08120 [Crocinitomicaceae bacterium]|nr:hypothetical protein [Crocinitomicaceae bacterium]MDG1776022.1 hypothetical protein [Crocinitomicaceae bacterium]
MSEFDEVPKKSNGGYVLVIIVLLLMLGLMAYLWSAKNGQLNQCKNENKSLSTDMKGMNEMMSGYVGGMTNDIKTDFKKMLFTYDALLEKDASKADSINKQKAEIQNLLEKVERGNLSARQLFSARKEIETMKGIMKGYIVQIDSLNTLNLQLASDLQVTHSQLSETRNERNQYKTAAELNAAKVEKGSKLQAYSFNSGGLKMRLNNTTTETTRARNTVQIKSSFTLSKNPITIPGKKTVYLQVITPEGKTLQSSTSNMTSADGFTVAYSDKKTIDYQNQMIDMAIYYKLNGKTVSKGNYKVNIYCQGQLIGTDSFTLR